MNSVKTEIMQQYSKPIVLHAGLSQQQLSLFERSPISVYRTMRTAAHRVSLPCRYSTLEFGRRMSRQSGRRIRWNWRRQRRNYDYCDGEGACLGLDAVRPSVASLSRPWSAVACETERALSGQPHACWWIVLLGAEKLDDTIRYSDRRTAGVITGVGQRRWPNCFD